jgi:hypothetical protein
VLVLGTGKAAPVRCAGWKGQRVPCQRPPATVVWGADHLPRLVCPGHEVPPLRQAFADAGDEIADPAGASPELLREWLGRERERQGKLRAEIRRLVALAEASDLRELDILAALHGQPRLELETG